MKAFAFQAVSWTVALLLFGLFLALVGPLVWYGGSELSWRYFFDAPSQFGLAGGIGPVLVSTFLILAVALALAILPSFATAHFLYFQMNKRHRLGEFILFSLKLLASIPSVVFGLFGMVVFCEWMGLGFSILSGAMTLAVMIVPTLCFSIYSSFLTFPTDVRAAAAGLCLSHWTQTSRLILPHASKGIAAGMILGVSRSLSETAALIFTSGYATRYPRSVFDSGRSLSIHIYEMGLNVTGGNARACAAALVLLVMLLLINLPIQLAFRSQARRHKSLVGY